MIFWLLVVPKALWRQKEPDCISRCDFSLALDPCDKATFIFRHRYEGRTVPRMMFLDNLSRIFAGLIFEIDD